MYSNKALGLGWLHFLFLYFKNKPLYKIKELFDT